MVSDTHSAVILPLRLVLKLEQRLIFAHQKLILLQVEYLKIVFELRLLLDHINFEVIILDLVQELSLQGLNEIIRELQIVVLYYKQDHIRTSFKVLMAAAVAEQVNFISHHEFLVDGFLLVLQRHAYLLAQLLNDVLPHPVDLAVDLEVLFQLLGFNINKLLFNNCHLGHYEETQNLREIQPQILKVFY